MAFSVHSLMHSSNICFVRLCAKPRLGHEDELKSDPPQFMPLWRLLFVENDRKTQLKQEVEGMTEDETVGWHHQLNAHGFEQAQRIGEGQGGLACCGPRGRKESDTTERPNNNKLVPAKMQMTGF